MYLSDGLRKLAVVGSLCLAAFGCERKRNVEIIFKDRNGDNKYGAIVWRDLNGEKLERYEFDGEYTREDLIRGFKEAIKEDDQKGYILMTFDDRCSDRESSNDVESSEKGSSNDVENLDNF